MEFHSNLLAIFTKTEQVNLDGLPKLRCFCRMNVKVGERVGSANELMIIFLFFPSTCWSLIHEEKLRMWRATGHSASQSECIRRPQRITSDPAALLLISSRPLISGHEFFVTGVETRGALQGWPFDGAHYSARTTSAHLMAALWFD